MKNKIKTLAVILSFIAVSCFAFAAGGFVAADSSESVEFSNEIVAVTPYNGEEVSIVNKSIEAMFEGYNGSYSSLSKVFYNNAEMASVYDGKIVKTAEERRAIYDKWDGFKPVNNTLKWNYDGEANYTVTVSRDSHLSTYVFKDTVAEKEVYLENILYPDTTYYWQVTANLANDVKVNSEIFTFTTKDTIRTIEIDGVSNTRDIGGFDSLYGKTLNGLIYRGGRLDDITEKGISHVNALGIKSDVDLRSLNEGVENPSGRENNFKYLNMIQYDFTSDIAKQQLVPVIRIFANPDNYPIYFHCAIGRDRTGTLSFVLNNLLGVSKEEIICEYFTSALSVAGAGGVAKEDDQLFQAIINMYAQLDNYEGENYAEKTANFLLSIGITQAEIDAIRNIMTGKTAVLPADAENTEGYDDKAFVSFVCFGVEDETVIVNKGATVSFPYSLPEGYVWTVGGVAADLSAPINSDVTFVAKKADGFTVTVMDNGAKTEKFYVSGSTVDFAQFDKDGYNRFVLNENGDIITSLTVNRDITVSVVYIKK